MKSPTCGRACLRQSGRAPGEIVMRIIVIGAGELGRLLAAALSEEDHDVVIVDSDADELARVSDKFDAMTIAGSCSSVDVL